MADNVAVTAGSGTTIAADEVSDGTLGSCKVQFVKIMDGTLDGTSKAAVGASGLAVDVKAVISGTGATNLGKAEDDAHSSGDVGIMALSVRKNTAAATSGTDGDYQPLITDTNGRLHTVLDTSTVGGATSIPAGTNAIGKLAANSGVDIGDVDVTSIIPGSGATNLGKAEDGAHSSGDVGVMALSVRQDTAAATSGTDGDYQPLITDSTGRLHCNVSNTITVASHAVTNAGTFATQSTPATSGGLSKFHLVTVGTSADANNVKSSAGQVYCITAFNLNASPRYLKFHNTSGTPTAGSGVTDAFMIPGNTAGAGVVINIDCGIAFSTGIGITVVTGIADSNSTASTASEMVLNIYYK